LNQTLEQEVKDDNRVVAGWLLYYHERKADYERRRETILHSSGASAFDGQPRGTDLGDTTGRKGDKLAELHERTGDWLELVEDVERRLPWKMQIFLRLRREYRYARGRNGWTAAVQHKYADEIAARLKKKPEDTWIESRNTFTRWWDKIIEYTGRLAAKKGLL
jgi:hypothetical protein